MEQSNRKSSLKSYRKPLSDCTNTFRNQRNSSKLISQKTLTLINKPPKNPSILPPVNDTTNSRKNQNPNLNLNTSTGSNNSPVSDSVPSHPVTPISCPGDKVCRKSGRSATLTRRQNEQTRKDKEKSGGTTPSVRAVQISSSAVSGDGGGHVSRPRAVENHEVDEQIRKNKGKMVVETPIIHMSVGTTTPVLGSTYLTSRGVHISSSGVSGDGGHVFRPHAVENHEVDEQVRKDKGKMVVETPIIHMSVGTTIPVQGSTYLTSRAEQISEDGGHVSRPHAVENHEMDEQIRKDKGKMVVEMPSIQISSPLMSHMLQTSSSDASGSFYLPGPSEVDEQIKKDKGKMVVETPIIHISSPLQTSSSAAAGNIYLPGPSEVDEQIRKDKGKMVVETPIIHISSPFAASGNSCLPRPSAVHIHEQDAHAKKDDRKIIQETPNLLASDIATPRSLRSSSSAASGTDGQEKTGLIVYSQRRTTQRKKIAVESIFSCPPGKRTRNNGIERDGGGGDGYSGSHTDPLPLHKKKRSRNKKNDSMHATLEDEVKKLKAYFEELDKFDLPEEVASESELE